MARFKTEKTEHPVVDAEALQALTYFVKKFKGIVELLPVLEHSMSLDQSIREREAAVVNLDTEIVQRSEQRDRVISEVESADRRVDDILAEAKRQYDATVDKATADAKSIVSKARLEAEEEVRGLKSSADAIKQATAVAEENRNKINEEVAELTSKKEQILRDLAALKQSL